MTHYTGEELEITSMAYLVTIVILILTVVGFFWWSRRGLSSFGWLQWLMRVLVALPLVGSGLTHFTRTALFASIIPPFLPYHHALVLISGGMELAGAVGILLPIFTRAAATCLSILMIAIFPANVYAANQYVGGMHMPSVPVRTAMQVVYIILLLLAGWGLPRRQAAVRA
jgi:uncharacterized membrane protein